MHKKNEVNGMPVPPMAAVPIIQNQTVTNKKILLSLILAGE
jgi:hypothetical protein